MSDERERERERDVARFRSRSPYVRVVFSCWSYFSPCS